MTWLNFVVPIVLALINITAVFNPDNLYGFTYGDPEIGAYVAYLIGQGARLYKDFAIVYGPARFLALAGINRLFGVEFSIPLLDSYMNLWAQILVPWGIFVLVRRLLTETNSLVKNLAAVAATVIYCLFLRSGQDIHGAVIGFICCYDWANRRGGRWRWALAALTWAIIGFLRVETGVFAFVAVTLVEILRARKGKFNWRLYRYYLGFQAGYLLLVIFYGSIANFWHDVVEMGIVAQPRLMKVPIEAVNYPLFELLLILCVLTLVEALVVGEASFLLMAILNMFLFSNAINRADFGHYYYGWVLAMPAVTIGSIKIFRKYREIVDSKLSVASIGLSLLLVTLLVVTVKAQSNIGLLGLTAIILWGGWKFKKDLKPVVVVIVILALHIFIRSRSLFLFYAKSQFSYPRISKIINDYKQIGTFFEQLSQGNYGGYQLDKDNTEQLKKMRMDLADKKVFIYPSNATLYYELNQKPPIRYLYFNNEYTERMEKETINMLSLGIEYVLLSNELTRDGATVANQTKNIQDYIEGNYKVVEEYPFINDKMLLMERRVKEENLLKR